MWVAQRGKAQLDQRWGATKDHPLQESVPKARHQTGRSEQRGCLRLILPLSLSPQGPACPSRPTYPIGPAQERPDQAVCVLELHVDKGARKNSRGSGKGNPHFGKSNFVSSTLTHTGKIEENLLNTSGRRRAMTSVECAPTSWVLFSVFLRLRCPGITGAPNYARPWPHSVLLQQAAIERKLFTGA